MIDKESVVATVNQDDVKIFYNVLNHQHKNHKFQCFKKNGKPTKKFNVNSVETLLELCETYNLQGLSCLTVNVTKEEGTKIVDITEIDNILIDVNVKKDRKKNGVSTPTDKNLASYVAKNIIKELKENINFRVSLFVDSGNGYHIYIPLLVKLDNSFIGKTDKENSEIWEKSDIRRRLITLEKQLEHFNNDICNIDCISKDIARRVKIPGTWNVKKEITEEKNYRLAKIINANVDAISDISIESNTAVFDSLIPYKECISDESETINFVDILKSDKKVTSKQIPIDNGDKRIATLQIMGKNKFRITGIDGDIIFPSVTTGKKWTTSDYYIRKIVKALTEKCKLTISQAQEISYKICDEADKKIRWLEKKGAFSLCLSDENQGVLDEITKVSITQSVDSNVYNLHLNGEIIKLTDKEFYDGPYHFCIGYFNRFLRKIVIDQEEWDKKFIPHLLSKEMVELEEGKIESKLDIICRKFLQHIKNKAVYDWEDIEKRTSYKNALYLVINTNIVLICGELVQDFFERYKVQNVYKETVARFNSFLRLEKKLIIEERTQQRIGDNKRKSFWQFDAGKLGISKDNIAKEEGLEQKTTDKNTPNVNDFIGMM